MRRSFRSAWYAVISNSLQVAMLAGVIVGLVTCFLTGEQLIIFFVLLYLVPFVILESTLPEGRPHILSRQLTPLFYAIRSPLGRWSVVQKRSRSSKGKDCRDLLRMLTAQQRLLPGALMAGPGKYRAITHEYVLRRIEQIPGAVIESMKPVYMADMTVTLNALTGGTCAKCTRKCPSSFGSKEKRQFYDVRFTIYDTRKNTGLDA